MAWITPITDRTLLEVNELIAVRTKIQATGMASLTVAELVLWWGNESLYLYGVDDPLYTSDLLALLSIESSDIGEVRGALNIIDLNRIEDNIIYLRDQLLSNGYGSIITPRASAWVMEDIPYIVEEINRIRANVRNLVGMLPVGTTPVITDSDYLNYVQLNDLELSLKTLYDDFALMILNYNPCGTLVCGEVY